MEDPLIVLDWDGNGRKDLILAGANQLFRWDLAGGWSTNLIIPFDDVHFQAASVADLTGMVILIYWPPGDGNFNCSGATKPVKLREIKA